MTLTDLDIDDSCSRLRMAIQQLSLTIKQLESFHIKQQQLKLKIATTTSPLGPPSPPPVVQTALDKTVVSRQLEETVEILPVAAAAAPTPPPPPSVAMDQASSKPECVVEEAEVSPPPPPPSNPQIGEETSPKE